MEFDFALFILLAALLLLVAALLFRRCVIYEYQQGLLYTRGKFSRALKAGAHYYFRLFQSVTKIDIRIANVTIPGQETLSADNVSIKVSLAASYRVSDPYVAVNKVANYIESLYLLLQLNARDVIGSFAIDDLLVKREEIGKIIYDKSASKAAELGVELFAVNLKDIMFPGEIKNVFAQVVNAKKEGLAALERARGESAALRNLANAASLFENNPGLKQLRLFQALEKNSNNTVVIISPEEFMGSRILKGLEKKAE
jgi:regulator of protease activity HflC (stomatin/prohibitin superfamily)